MARVSVVDSWHMTGYAALSYCEAAMKVLLQPKGRAEREAVKRAAWGLVQTVMKEVLGDLSTAKLGPGEVIRYWKQLKIYLSVKWLLTHPDRMGKRPSAQRRQHFAAMGKRLPMPKPGDRPPELKFADEWGW